MAVPAAPTENGGSKVLFVLDDNAGTNRANLLRAYQRTTLNGEGVADLGVYPTSGSFASGYKATTGSSEIQVTGSSIPCQGMIVKADPDNTLDVWVGITGLTVNKTAATEGYRLAPGESVGVPCRNANTIYIRSTASGAGVYWIASKD
jgi:hypothetical protein